jgi:hypothetical protein
MDLQCRDGNARKLATGDVHTLMYVRVHVNVARSRQKQSHSRES